MAIATRRLGIAIKAAMGSDGLFVAQNNVISQSAPHLHVHLVPRFKGDGLFSTKMIWRRVRYRDAGHMSQVAALIREAVKP